MENKVKKETPDDSFNESKTAEQVSDLDGVVVKVEQLHHAIDIKEDDFIMEAESTIEDPLTCKSCETTRKYFSGSKSHSGKKLYALEACRHKQLNEPQLLEKTSHDSFTKLKMEPKKRLNYTKEMLVQALESIKSNCMSIGQASKTFKIPKTTLVDKINNKYTLSGNVGAQTVLSASEEEILVKWIIEMGERGFLVTKAQLLESVAKLVKHLNRENTFKQGIPGYKWYNGFLKRHPEISNRVSQKLTTIRAAAVTAENIRDWFYRVRSYLSDNDFLDILDDPQRIFNSEECGFYLSPEEKQVLVRKGSKKVYSRVSNDEKECLTVLLTVSADGAMQPPMVLYPYKKRIPRNIHIKYPKNWGIGQTESGWVTSEAFFPYITNVFYPWIEEKKIPRPVILFIDGNSSHINLNLSQFCKEKGIILTAFYHRLQPLDVCIFYPIKNVWRRNIREWRKCNTGQKLPREDFASVLELSLDKVVTPEIVSCAFRTFGLFPFSENNIDHSKFIKTTDFLTHNQLDAPEKQQKQHENVEIPLDKMVTPEIVGSAFHTCGLFPFNDNNIDHSKFIKTTDFLSQNQLDAPEEQQQQHENVKIQEDTEITNLQLLSEIEKRLCPTVIEKFKAVHGKWNGDVEYKALFDFWRNLN